MIYDYLLKVVTVGDSGVGKTSLVYQFAENKFSRKHVPTIGCEFACKTLEVQGKILKLHLWDTAGQEVFRSLARCYYKFAAIIFLIFDVTQRKSFININYWLNEIKNHQTKHCVILLVANKVDLDSREVSYEEGFKLAQENNLIYFETSALSGSGVNDSFNMACSKIVEKINTNEIVPDDEQSGVKKGRKEFFKISAPTIVQDSGCQC